MIATAGGSEKTALAEELGADVAIDYRRADFAAAVLEATGGRGVDVCFDGVGGEVTLQSLRCLARGGRHLVVGFAGGIEAEEVPTISGRMLCFGNFDVLGVILAYLDDDITPSPDWPLPGAPPRFNPPPASQGRQVHEDLVGLLDAGKIRPLVGAVVPFEDLPRALDRMEARATTGRVVILR